MCFPNREFTDHVGHAGRPTWKQRLALNVDLIRSMLPLMLL